VAACKGSRRDDQPAIWLRRESIDGSLKLSNALKGGRSETDTASTITGPHSWTPQRQLLPAQWHRVLKSENGIASNLVGIDSQFYSFRGFF
jgi:hypothetical protein